MAAQFGVTYPLWSFAGDDDALLERLRGEVGIDYLVVPAITGSVSTFRLEPPTPPQQFDSEGGWHYQPERASYHGAVKPRPADWVGQRHPHLRLLDWAAARGVAVWARFAPLPAIGAPRRDAHVLQRNAWDEPLAAVGACPVNPEVQELIADALQEWSALKIVGVELGGVLVDSAAGPALGMLEFVWRAARRCFCPACRQCAEQRSVDAEMVARAVRSVVESASRHERVSPEAIERLAAVAGPYDAARRSLVELWLARLAERAPHVEHRLFAAEAGANPVLPARWRNVGAIAPATDGIDAVRTEAEVALDGWVAGGGDALVRIVNTLVHQGVARVTFEGVDAAPRFVVPWLKQAVRFGRRESI